VKISIITPTHNEEENIGKCLQSLVKQSFKPQQIIVVDDGSTDKTLKVVSDYADERFQIVTRPRHKKGDIHRVPYVLREGSRLLDDNFDFVAILDADTVLEKDYYLKLTKALKVQANMGIAGGKLCNQPDTGLILGLLPYVYGCNRVYTRECWMKLNEGKVMKPVPSWDTYHNVYARMLGFNPKRVESAVSWSLRPTRTTPPFLKGYVSYQLGYPMWYLFGRAARNLSPAMSAGYLKALVSGEKQYPTKQFVRQMQVERVTNVFGRLLF